jgi:hypothetical protein
VPYRISKLFVACSRRHRNAIPRFSLPATAGVASQCRKTNGASLYQPQRRSLVGERLEKERSGLTDERKTLGEDGGVSIPDLYVVAARRARVETNRARNHKGGGFGFRLADALRGGAAAFSAMQEFVRQFVSQRGKFFGRGLAGQEYDLAAIGDATGGSDLVRLFDRNSPRFGECLELKYAVLGIALNASNRRQFLAVGLGDVEHIGCAEASHGGRTFSRFFVLY